MRSIDNKLGNRASSGVGIFAFGHDDIVNHHPLLQNHLSSGETFLGGHRLFRGRDLECRDSTLNKSTNL